MELHTINHILIYSGVTVSNCPQEFDRLYKKLSNYFLTPENEQWFISKNSGSCSKSQYLFWELFSFGLLYAAQDDEAVKSFEKLNINSCYLVQMPQYNLCPDAVPAYFLKGEYDVSLIDDDDRETSFKNLKEFIKKDVPIPFWVIDNLSSSIGREIYAFDDSLNWVLVLTHENEVYLYKSDGIKNQNVKQ